MRSGLHLLLSLSLAVLLGCGSSPSTSANSGSGAVTGGYILTVAPGTANASNFYGALTVTGASVTGVFQDRTTSGCVSSTQDIPFNGSVVNNVLTLTSGTYSGSVATVTIQLPLVTNTGGTTTASGTIVVTGGTCALASTPLTAALAPSAAGTWNGTFTSPGNATAIFMLATTGANTDGQFPLTGTVTFNSTGCTATAQVTGLAIGYSVQLSSVGNTVVSASFNTSTTPATASIATSCGSFTGTVTH